MFYAANTNPCEVVAIRLNAGNASIGQATPQIAVEPTLADRGEVYTYPRHSDFIRHSAEEDNYYSPAADTDTEYYSTAADVSNNESSI